MFWSARPYFVLTMFKFFAQNKKNQGDQGGRIQLIYIFKKRSQPTNVNGKGKKPRVATKKEDFFFKI